MSIAWEPSVDWKSFPCKVTLLSLELFNQVKNIPRVLLLDYKYKFEANWSRSS